MDLTPRPLYYSARFDRALQFSAQWHDHQYRKGTPTPYVVHPVAVAFLLRSYGYSESIQIAGLLHDVVEDTECSFEQIEGEFGKGVSEVVDWCTELSKGRSWEERKSAMIEKLKVAPAEVKAVAGADKAHNLNTILDVWERDGDEIWNRFSRGASHQLTYYQQVLESLGMGFSDSILNELRDAVHRFEMKMSVAQPSDKNT